MLNNWSPALLVGTRLNLLLCSFDGKDEKQIKVFNRRDARVTECEESRTIKSMRFVVDVGINQDAFVIKFLSL